MEDVARVADLQRQRQVRVAGLDQRLALVEHRLEVGGRLGGEGGVAEQGDVLDRVGQAVGEALVGHGLDGDLGEVAGRVAELQRRDGAVGDELAEPVVGADDDVRALADGTAGDEVLADGAEVELLHGDGEVVLLAERVADLLDDRGARVVGPDDEVGVGALDRRLAALDGGLGRRHGALLRGGLGGGAALGGGGGVAAAARGGHEGEAGDHRHDRDASSHRGSPVCRPARPSSGCRAT